VLQDIQDYTRIPVFLRIIPEFRFARTFGTWRASIFAFNFRFLVLTMFCMSQPPLVIFAMLRFKGVEILQVLFNLVQVDATSVFEPLLPHQAPSGCVVELELLREEVRQFDHEREAYDVIVVFCPSIPLHVIHFVHTDAKIRPNDVAVGRLGLHVNAITIGAAPSSLGGRYLKRDKHFGVGFDFFLQLIPVFLETFVGRECEASRLLGLIFRLFRLGFRVNRFYFLPDSFDCRRRPILDTTSLSTAWRRFVLRVGLMWRTRFRSTTSFRGLARCQL
jgi:hypothetical protein